MNTHIKIAEAPDVSAVRAMALIVLGIMAVAFPVVASITTTYVVAWVLIVAGGTYLLVAWRENDSMVWAGVVSLVYVLAGIVILANPLWGIASIALVLGITLMVEGGLSVFAYFTSEDASGWMLLGGCVTIVLALVIASGWLSTSLWMLGTLVGINLMMRGVFDLAAWMERERLSHPRAS